LQWKEAKTVSSKWLRTLGSLVMLASAFTAVAPVTATAYPSGNAPVTRCPQRDAARGTLTVSDVYYGQNLNPFVAASSFASLLAMFDDLYRYDDRARLFPMMARSIPTLKNGGIRGGGRVIVIQLKSGLRWSNGSEITSADIRFGWQIGMDPVSGPACAGTCDVITSIDTPDRYTAVLHLKRADPALISPSIIQNGQMPFLWPAHWRDWSGNPHAAAVKLYQDPSYMFLSPSYPTDGPYQVVSAGPSKIVFAPMKYYDDMNCGAPVNRLVLGTYNTGSAPSSAAQVQAAISDKIDLGLDYFPPDVSSLVRHRGRYSVHVVPTFAFELLEFNLDATYQGKANPLSNPKVRLALALALDKRSAVAAALNLDPGQGGRIEAWTPWVITQHLVQPYADSAIRGQWDPLANGGKGAYLASTGSGQALSDARKLLAQTPWKQGFGLDLYTTGKPERLTMMSVVAATWARLHVRVNPHTVNAYPDFFGSWEQGGILEHGAFQVAELAEIGGSNPDDLALLLEGSYVDRDKTTHNYTLDQNYAGIRDPTIDRAFGQAIQTDDQKVRKRDYRIVQERLNQRAYWIPLYYDPSISSSSSRVVGYRPDPDGFNVWNIYDLRVK
jgi:ABC-type transport system substrate-binding protein